MRETGHATLPREGRVLCCLASLTCCGTQRCREWNRGECSAVPRGLRALGARTSRSCTGAVLCLPKGLAPEVACRAALAANRWCCS